MFSTRIKEHEKSQILEDDKSLFDNILTTINTIKAT